MDLKRSETHPPRVEITPEAARQLSEHGVVRDCGQGGAPHFLLKVPDLEQAAQVDIGIEVNRDDDGCVAVAVLLYDRPTEPVSYDVRFYPDQPEDSRFLWAILDAARFRLHPCQQVDGSWNVGPAQTLRLPPSMLLRMKHFSLSWPQPATQIDPAPIAPCAPAASRPAKEASEPDTRPDPRDTVIRKLKEQTEALRAQIRERDKRIVELEDELSEIRSRGRTYRLSGKDRPWWKPF